RCPSLYLSPLSDKQIAAYLRKRFPRTFWKWLRRTDDPKHGAAESILSKLDTLHMRPMLLAHIDDLLKIQTTRRGLTSYTAFETLVQEWLRREQRRKTELEEGHLWFACTEIAIRMDKLERRFISASEVA